MNIDSDRWLASILDCQVFKVAIPGITETDLSAFIAHIYERNRAFYYAKLPTDNIRLVNQFVSIGFRIVDVNITFQREPAKIDPSSIFVREASPEDEARVLKIAASCFSYSRFHLDPLIPNEIANMIKREWVANYFRKQRGEKLFVAELNSEIVGFNAVLKVQQNIRVIDLIGVDKNYWGRGVGKALVESFINESQNQYERLMVGTQIANIPSVNLYERCGFKSAGASYVLHAHIRDGKVIQ